MSRSSPSARETGERRFCLLPPDDEVDVRPADFFGAAAGLFAADFGATGLFLVDEACLVVGTAFLVVLRCAEEGFFAGAMGANVVAVRVSPTEKALF